MHEVDESEGGENRLMVSDAYFHNLLQYKYFCHLILYFLRVGICLQSSSQRKDMDRED